jgi:hypothetical protein
MTELMKPIVNLNGTSRDDLIEQRMLAREAIRQAMEALQQTEPNGRDYIGHKEAYERDLAIYRQRLAMLDKLYNELELEAIAIQDGE